MIYLSYFLISFLLAVIFAVLVKFLAQKLNILDAPDLQRKIHVRPTPLLGGLAIFLSFFICLGLASQYLLQGELELRHWMGFFGGGLFLMIGGFLDDKYNFKPSRQIIWPILAIVAVIIGGVEIEKITNPLGGFIRIDYFPIDLWFFTLLPLADLLIFVWLLLMMYTTKLLDGVDGLVSGIGAIGSLIIFLFTTSTQYFQPDIALASLIFSAACLGFLVFNWSPAKIFLGEGGSILIGFVLGVLAIISGGKIAIALLVLGLPILDVVWTVIRRLWLGRNPFKSSDKKHLHHRLLELGLGHKKTVLIFYFFSLFFGLLGLFLQSSGKIMAIFALIVIMMSIVISFSFLDKKRGTIIKRQ